MDEDDQEQLETERIDVTKDIALHDDMQNSNNNASETVQLLSPIGKDNDFISGNHEPDTSIIKRGSQENVQKLFLDV